MGSKYGKYTSDSRTSSKDRGPQVHPVWRGIGFAFMVLIPIMSYALMTILLEQNNVKGWIPLTEDMMVKRTDFLYKLVPDPEMYVKIAVFLLSLFIFYAIFMIISAIFTGMFGVSKKDDPFYVPPVRHTKVPERRIRR